MNVREQREKKKRKEKGKSNEMTGQSRVLTRHAWRGGKNRSKKGKERPLVGQPHLPDQYYSCSFPVPPPPPSLLTHHPIISFSPSSSSSLSPPGLLLPAPSSQPMALETLTQHVRMHMRQVMERRALQESGAAAPPIMPPQDRRLPDTENPSPAATPTVSDSTRSFIDGRGKRLTLDEQRALVRICAEYMINPDPKAYPKNVWVLVSQKLLERTQRKYSWQSCRRWMCRLVSDRQMHWEAVDENRRRIPMIDDLLAAEVDQWMGVCVRSHEQLKTPEAMLQRRLQKPPARQSAYDAETEAQLRYKQERVLKWVSLLPDDAQAFADELQSPLEHRPSTPDPREPPRQETFDQKLKRMMSQDPQYKSSDYSSGLEEELLARDNGTLRTTKKRLREETGDDLDSPPSKYISRPNAVKEPSKLGELRLHETLSTACRGDLQKSAAQLVSEIPIPNASTSRSVAWQYLTILKLATDALMKAHDKCVDIFERDKNMTDDDFEDMFGEIIKLWSINLKEVIGVWMEARNVQNKRASQ